MSLFYELHPSRENGKNCFPALQFCNVVTHNWVLRQSKSPLIRGTRRALPLLNDAVSRVKLHDVGTPLPRKLPLATVFIAFFMVGKPLPRNLSCGSASSANLRGGERLLPGPTISSLNTLYLPYPFGPCLCEPAHGQMAKAGAGYG